MHLRTRESGEIEKEGEEEKVWVGGSNEWRFNWRRSLTNGEAGIFFLLSSALNSQLSLWRNEKENFRKDLVKLIF